MLYAKVLCIKNIFHTTFSKTEIYPHGVRGIKFAIVCKIRHWGASLKSRVKYSKLVAILCQRLNVSHKYHKYAKYFLQVVEIEGGFPD